MEILTTRITGELLLAETIAAIHEPMREGAFFLKLQTGPATQKVCWSTSILP